MVDELNALLLHISKELSAENLTSLTFLCSDVVGKKHLEKVKSGTDLFRLLKEMDKITHVDTAYLFELLREIKRDDLADIVREFQSKNGHATIPIELDEREQEKLRIVSDIIVDHLGKDWRKYGRKLGLHEGQLDQIREKHQNNLNEQVIGVIEEWKRKQKGDVKAEQLIVALRSCKLNYTADLVKKALEHNGFSE